MTGTNLKGTNVISMIVPTNHADTYATHDSIYGKGGWREVDTLAERDAIPAERRRRGMVVFVKETYKSYQLKNSDTNGGWVPFPATEDVSDIINEAIASGTIVIDLSSCVKKSEFEERMQEYYTSTKVDDLFRQNTEEIKEWVEDKHYLTEHQSLEACVTKESLASTLDNYVLASTLEQELQDYLKIAEIDEHLTDYVKNETLDLYTTKEELTTTLEGYATTDVTDAIKTSVNTLENVGFVTATELADKGYLNADNATELIKQMGYVDNEALATALTSYATTDAVTKALEVYPTKDEVQQTLTTGGYLTVKDLQGYATELWVKDYLVDAKYIQVKDLQGYATEKWVEDYVKLITGEIVDLTSYQKKEDETLVTEDKTIVGAINELANRPAVDAYTKAETDEKIAGIHIPSKVSELENDANYLTEHQSLDALATKEELAEEVKNAVKYSDFEYNGQRKTIQLANYDSISGVATDGTGHNLAMVSKWDVADFGAPGLHMNLNTLDKVTINDKENVATESYVNEKVKDMDLTEYVKKSEVEENYVPKTEYETLKATVETLQAEIEKMKNTIKEPSYLIIGEDGA